VEFPEKKKIVRSQNETIQQAVRIDVKNIQLHAAAGRMAQPSSPLRP
jgi:hypothetical protein